MRRRMHTLFNTEKETIMSTNGYEIRLELLKMAKELLEQDWHAHRESAMADYRTKVTFAQRSESALVPSLPTLKPYPTEAEIITKAKSLNEFINSKY